MELEDWKVGRLEVAGREAHQTREPLEPERARLFFNAGSFNTRSLLLLLLLLLDPFEIEPESTTRRINERAPPAKIATLHGDGN